MIFFNQIESEAAIMNIKIVIEKGSDGYFVANCPVFKGCWSQGKTEKEAIKNIREAIALYLEPVIPKVRRSSFRKVLTLNL